MISPATRTTGRKPQHDAHDPERPRDAEPRHMSAVLRDDELEYRSDRATPSHALPELPRTSSAGPHTERTNAVLSVEYDGRGWVLQPGVIQMDAARPWDGRCPAYVQHHDPEPTPEGWPTQPCLPINSTEHARAVAEAEYWADMFRWYAAWLMHQPSDPVDWTQLTPDPVVGYRTVALAQRLAEVWEQVMFDGTGWESTLTIPPHPHVQRIRTQLRSELRSRYTGDQMVLIDDRVRDRPTLTQLRIPA